MLRAAVIVLLIALLPAYARAEARIALLIGNQAYNPKVGPLKNPHDDIALVGAALRSLGFTVTEVTDADYRSMDAAIKRHAAAVRREGQGSISLLYYSGHGAADPDTKTNYLIPIDVSDADDADLWNYSLNLNKIVEGLREQAPAATHYVVFDACRNELNLTRKGQKALADKGFVPVAYTPGVMVAYATAPGKTAADAGTGGGPYAKALAEELVKPGVEAMTMFRRVALRVNREIGQDPWMSASTLPEIYLAGKIDAQSAKSSEAAQAWNAVKDTNDINDIGTLEAFRRQYGTANQFYDRLAEIRIVELKRKQAEAVRQRTMLQQQEDEKRRAEAAASKKAADAAKKKSEDEAHAKAEAERQRLTMLQQQEDEKRRAEAAASKKAADAAKKKSEDEARAKAEAERQRLAMLQQDNGKKRTEAEIAPQAANTIAALPKIDKSQGVVSFDGAWTITRIGEGHCGRGRVHSFPITIQNGQVTGEYRGTISASGAFRYIGRGLDGNPTYFAGTFQNSSGRGTFKHPKCAGTFTARRR